MKKLRFNYREQWVVNPSAPPAFGRPDDNPDQYENRAGRRARKRKQKKGKG